MDTHMKRALGAITNWDTFKRMTETQTGLDSLLPGHAETHSPTTPPEHHFPSSLSNAGSTASNVDLSAGKPAVFAKSPIDANENERSAEKNGDLLRVDEAIEEIEVQAGSEEHHSHHREHHHGHGHHHNGVNGA
jgi:alpha,alpha-trehalase